MGGLFTGSPQQATSYTTESTQTPRWMQDAIYNQIQVATNIANTPYQNYMLPTVADMSPLQQQAIQKVAQNQGSWQPGFNQAQQNLAGASTTGTASGLSALQNQYLMPGRAQSDLNQAQDYLGQAGSIDAQAAAQPYMNAAGQSAVANIGQYMNPYQSQVMDVIARQGARNLSENLLPSVADSFIKAGQFGGTRMGEFGSRALRDTHEAILDQQAQLANQGYTQAMDASQTDLGRQAQLGQMAGSLAGQQQSNLASIGGQYLGAGQAQQQYGLNAAGQSQAAQQADLERQMSGAVSLGNMAQAGQQMQAADVAALDTAGLTQQQQQQRQLDAAYGQWQDQQLYPRQQMDWLSTQIRGMAPITPTQSTQQTTSSGNSYSPSPLAQLGSLYGLYRGVTG